MLDVTPSHRAGTGTPLVLLHGFTDTWRAWSTVLPELERHHDVFAPTLPGHAGADGLGAPLSWEGLVDAVEASIDAQGFTGPVHLAGNSLGGWLALELAGRGRARSVVGLCPAGGWEPGSREGARVIRYFRQTGVLLGLAAGRAELLAGRPRLRTLALRDLVAHPRRVPPAAAAHMVRSAAACELRDEMVAMSRDEHFRDLGPIECPVRITWGAEDRLLPPARYSARLRRILPGAEFTEIPGAGHLPMWDEPDACARAILEVTVAADTTAQAAAA
jgi:pimeloyl-ACP methyl ester carboxylesterase